jgi:predicted enzyme related to lactoylglutathione lyase
LFYQQALGLKVEVSDKTHDLLVGQNYEVVVHAISKAYAQSIEIESPPKRRDDVALKPTFVVDDLEVVRAAAKANGGYLKPTKQAWLIRGFIVLDGCDPEGNVIQFKQLNPV